MLGWTNRHIINLAKAIFSCAHGDWVTGTLVQLLGHAML